MKQEKIFEEMEYSSEINFKKVLSFDIYKNYQYYIFNMGAHPTAYIVLDKTDKLYGLNMEELDEILGVHCGFTYAENQLQSKDYSYVNLKEDKWVIGWDYGHYKDWSGLFPDDLNSDMGNKKWTTHEILTEVHEAIDKIIEYNKGE